MIHKVRHTLHKLGIRKDDTKRVVLIDFHRGLILLLMVITHVIALTYNYAYNDGVVYYIGLIGGIASFTGFLFLSGASGYLSFVGERGESPKGVIRIFEKEIKIFAIYYILAILALLILGKASFNTPFDWLVNIKSIVTFSILPEFTEFLPALAIFSLTLIFFKKIYHYLSNKIWLSVGVGLIIFFIGSLLVHIPVEHNSLIALQSLLVGHVTDTLRVHSFPIFQYFIIFLLGIVVGRFLHENTGQKTRLVFISKILTVTIPATIVLSLIYLVTKIPLFYPLPVEGRFPPSLAFITFSLSIAITFLGALDYIIQYIPGIVSRILTYLSRNALGFFLAHLIILFSFKYFYDLTGSTYVSQPTDFLGILIVFAITISLSFLFVHIGNILHTRLIHNREYIHIIRYAINPKNLYKIVFLGVMLLGFSIFYANEIVNTNEGQKNPQELASIKADQWWDDGYKVKRELTIQDKTQEDYQVGKWVQFAFDHASAFANTLSYQKDASDIRIVYFNPNNGTFVAIPMIIASPDTSRTTVLFQLQEIITAGGSDNNYFMYYGNADVMNYPKSINSAKDVVENEVTAGKEEVHDMIASTNRFWFLKSPKTNKVSDQLIFHMSPQHVQVDSSSTVSYSIEKIQLHGIMTKDATGYTATVNLDNLSPDVYTIQAEVVNAGSAQVVRSYKVPFKITYPLYVTWSLDWEGWDVTDSNLAELNTIANTYNIPVTELFNPRIYVKNQTSFNSTSPDRAAYLTSWILNRAHLYGDEIGMHLHMFADMVSEAGVTPVTNGGGAYGEAKISDFTSEELGKIFTWAFSTFQAHGLPAPVTFRSGGWFSSPQVLKAEQDAGFLIDTSGRTPGTIDMNNPRSTPLPWDLKGTTWPYLPTDGDINRWVGDRLSIWEFPNNGADSYWFSTQDLINRFTANDADPRGILAHPQVLTYLSHPHWLVAVDKPKLNALFQYIGKDLYSKDEGPVVYTTLKGAYDQWDTVNDINGN